jgi:hypothetical protein
VNYLSRRLGRLFLALAIPATLGSLAAVSPPSTQAVAASANCQLEGSEGPYTLYSCVDLNPREIAANTWRFHFPLGLKPVNPIRAQIGFYFHKTPTNGIQVDYDYNGNGIDFSSSTTPISGIVTPLYLHYEPPHNFYGWNLADLDDGIVSGVVYATAAPTEIRFDVVAPSFVSVTTSVTTKKVVFLQGVCSELTNSRNPGPGPFDDLQRLLKKEYGYGDNDFLGYSYRGGIFDANGSWLPNTYLPMDPISQDFRTTSLAALHDQLLVPYRARYPNTTFVLVGHSLGGMVAMQEVLQKVDSPDYQRGFLSTVITVDSPLHGVPPTDTTLGILVPGLECVSNGQAALLLVGIHNNEPTTSNVLKQKVMQAKEQGVTVATVGNTYDCVWSPNHCKIPLLGDMFTQWIFESVALTKVYSIPEPCLSPQSKCFHGTHSAVLDRKSTESLRQIADYVGRQN